MNKIFAFDYMLSLFEQWYKDEGKESMNFQNCSKLSVLKLLFLTAAPKREGARDLLEFLIIFMHCLMDQWRVIYIMLFKITDCHLIL